ncbi:ATP-binding cassette sub-family A member 3, partial [Operophtera brumata]
MSAPGKLKLLIWKNLLLQRRHKWQTIFEIASPVLFSLLLILTRCLVDPKTHPDIIYSNFFPTYFNISGMSIGGDSTDSSGTLAFSPENALTRKITRNTMKIIGEDNFGFLALFGNVPEPKGFKNAIEMERALTQPNAMDDVLVGIQFEDIMATIMRTTMKEHPMVANWRTNLLFPLFPQSGPREPGDKYGYSSEMFLAIQHGVSQGIIMQKSRKSVDTRILMQRLPQPTTREDPLLLALERFITVVIMIGFAYTFVNTWFSVLTFTPWSILFFFMILFVISSLAFSFMVSVFFSRANSAASFMGLIWFASYAVFCFTQMLYGQLSLGTKLALSLVSNTAVSFGFQMLVWCEGNGR